MIDRAVRLTLPIAALAVAVMPLLSQTAPPTRKPSFDAVSIKINKSGARPFVSGVGDRFVATNYTLKMLMIRAYADRPMLNNQIVGGPNWIDADHFDIEAKGSGQPIPPPEMKLRIQSLLEDRFRLKLHREMREMPVYSLVVGKNGPKIKLSSDQTVPDPRANTSEPRLRPNDPNYVPDLPRGQFGMMNTPSGMVLTGTAIPISTFVNLVQAQVDRPVQDTTNLKGLFDVRLKFTPSALSAGTNTASPATQSGPPLPYDPSSPSLFTALENQLGLHLEIAKTPVEVFVIDAVQRPSAN